LGHWNVILFVRTSKAEHRVKYHRQRILEKSNIAGKHNAESAWSVFGTRPLFAFAFRVATAHFTTYLIVGLFALTLFNYHYWYSIPPLNAYMLPTDHPQISLGPLLNLIRGFITGLVLYPFRESFLERKYGWVHLWILFMGIGVFGTFGPAPGSFEGMLYTVIPLWMQIAFLPETVIQALLMSIIVYYWQRSPGDKRIRIPILVLFIITLILASLAALSTFFMA